MNLADRQAILDGAWDKGHEKGDEEGEKAGKMVVALNLLEQGIDKGAIIQVTGLSQEELERLERKGTLGNSSLATRSHFKKEHFFLLDES